MESVNLKNRIGSKVWIRDRFEHPDYAPIDQGDIVALSQDEAIMWCKKFPLHFEMTDEAPNRESPPALGEGSSTKVPSAKDHEKVIDKVIAAIKTLDENDKSLWTTTGVPRVESLEAILGFDITMQQRLQAWRAVQAERAEEQEE